jgi:hypothetical protein
MPSWLHLLRALLLALAGVSALCAQSAQLTPTAIAALPAVAKPGDAVTFSVTVSNSAAQFPVTQSATFAVTLTNTVTGTSMVLSRAGVNPKSLVTAAVSSGGVTTPGTGTFDVTVTIPTRTTDAGTYRADVVVSALSDGGSGGGVSVSSPVLTVAGKPDLRVTSLSYPAGVAYKGGDVIPMSLTFTNQTSSFGTPNVPFVPSTSAPFFRIEVVLSSNPTFGDADDFLLTFHDIATRVNADGLDTTITWNQLLPGNYAGSYYVLAKVDTLNAVDETVENELAQNGNNVWFDVSASRIALQPIAFPTTYLVSTTGATPAASGNGYSDTPSTSGDGRYTAFVSDATNLVANDTNGARDVFIFDQQTQQARRVSLSAQGVQANGASANPAISGDGRFVAFASDATNLVLGDTNGFTDIFVVDVLTGVISRESLGSAGVQANGSSFRPSISQDGRYVAFESTATNLSPLVTAPGTHIYLRDRQTGSTTLVSQSGTGVPGNGASVQAAISADGRYVAFASDASNLVAADTNGVRDVFLRDVVAGSTVRVSVSSSGAQADGASRSPSLNRASGTANDGRYVAFASEAANLVVGDTNGVSDIFVYDRVAATTVRVSVSGSGAQAVDSAALGFRIGSINPSISGSGRYVAFASTADNLTPGDAAGRYSSSDANLALDVFVIDRDVSASGILDTPGNTATQMASVNRFGYQTMRVLGVPSTAASDIYPSISQDGRWVSFPSDAEGSLGLVHGATNRLSPDANNARDVVLFDRRINALPNPGSPPSVAITSPAAGTSTPISGAITVMAAASAQLGTVASVQFFANGTSLGTDTTYPYSVSWTPTATGTYSLSALVTDSFGNQAVSAVSSISIVPVSPGAPAVRLTSPSNGSVVKVGATATLTADARDSDGTIVSVQFLANGVPIGAPDTAAPYATAFTFDSEGLYRLSAVALNSGGTSVTASSVYVLAAAVGKADTVYTGNYQGGAEAGRFIALNAHGKVGVFVAYSTSDPTKLYYFPSLAVDAVGGFAAADAQGKVMLRGTASDTGISGNLDGGRLTFVGVASYPAATQTVTAGYYSGSVQGRSGSALTLLVGSDGVLGLYWADGGQQAAAIGNLDVTGAFNVVSPTGVRFTGRIDPATGLAAGTVGGSTGGAFTAGLASAQGYSDGTLANLSTRGQVGTGANILIAGLVVAGSAPKQVLVRAVGPGLAAFGVPGTLADPQITVFRGATPLAANDNWGDDAAIKSASLATGAFPLGAGSADAALLLRLEPGAYTAQVSGVGGKTGVALVEAYDVDTVTPFTAQKVLNVSTRGSVGAGGAQLIAGFVIGGNSAKKVLIRGVGPTLGAAPFNLAGVLADPVLRLVRADGTVVRENDNWEVGNEAALVSEANGKVGAFALAPGSRDAALLISLPPGAYTAQLSGASGGTGTGLIEVYEVP